MAECAAWNLELISGLSSESAAVFAFKLGELVGDSLGGRGRRYDGRTKLSPHCGAPSCDVVTDVTGQIDAPYLSYSTGTEMLLVIRCCCFNPQLLKKKKKKVNPMLFICCQRLPPSIRLLLTDIDWVLLVKLCARLYSPWDKPPPNPFSFSLSLHHIWISKKKWWDGGVKKAKKRHRSWQKPKRNWLQKLY